MFKMFSKSRSFSIVKAPQLIEKFDKTNITSCILAISKVNFLSNYNVNFTHAALFIIYNNSDASYGNRRNGILIEYGNYFPNMSKEEEKLVKDGYVIYRYGIKGGLRYYVKNYSDFLVDFGDIGYINMDIDLEDQMTFSNFMEQCAPLHENEWIQNNYSVIENNSHNFIIKALKILKPKFVPGMIKLNEQFNTKNEKINIFPEPIRKVLISLQNKNNTSGKIINKNKDENKDVKKDANNNANKGENKDENKDEDYRNKYEILSLIAKGGYGEVYKAIIKKTGELRAIKLISKVNIKENLRNEYNTNDIEGAFKEFQNKLLDEIKYMEICSNNNTNNNSIKYYDYYNTNENLVIVMELCDTNLQLLLNERKEGFVLEEIHYILNQLNNTFRIMKDNKIIHRDLKLANILVKYEDNDKNKFIVKLTDYGISKQLSSMSKCFTHTGTLLTMAPEILNEEEYNSKCDIWSLGIIIYQLYFKEYPYNGNTEISLLRKIDKTGQKCLKKANDPKLDNLIRKMRIKDQTQRYTWEQYLNDEFFKANELCI